LIYKREFIVIGIYRKYLSDFYISQLSPNSQLGHNFFFPWVLQLHYPILNLMRIIYLLTFNPIHINISNFNIDVSMKNKMFHIICMIKLQLQIFIKEIHNFLQSLIWLRCGMECSFIYLFIGKVHMKIKVEHFNQ
jgi:hypothetical protein